MILRRRTRGEPLVALVVLLAGWVGARVLAWDQVFDAERGGPVASSAPAVAPGRLPAAAPRRDAVARRAVPAPAAASAQGWAPLVPLLPQSSLVAQALLTPPPPLPQAGLTSEPPLVAPTQAPVSPLAADPPATPARRIMVAGGHQMMWLAATALLPFPPLGLRSAPPAATPAIAPRRWSGDGWMLLRRGDGTIAPGPVVGNYGASQVGAVLRYRLVLVADPHRPAAYVRATAALNGTREQQVAFGLSARPVPRVPITAMAEMRGVRDTAGERLRPALALVTELPPQPLPLGFTGELYAQAGYVGGRHATAFIDGLVRAERPVAELGAFRLRAGGGAWGAKQRGAARIDVGPTASVSFRLTDTASARVAADWRFRVGGASKPDSGPALTLSAGF